MYLLHAYGAMIADRVRMDAYAKAIKSRVRPGMTVLDLGTGTGIFSLLACRARARKVYAVDPSEAVQVGRQIARANALEDRIVFIQDRSSAIDLPEPVDLIISDMRGILPFFSSHLSDITDARDRFLSSTGHMIPLYDHIFGMLAETPQVYGEFVSPLVGKPLRVRYGCCQPVPAQSMEKSGKQRVQRRILPLPMAEHRLQYPCRTQRVGTIGVVRGEKGRRPWICSLV